MKLWIALSVLVLATGCATSSVDRNDARSSTDSATPSGSPNIDVAGLQRALGLERDPEDLGFQEKSFNTCEAGYGYSSSHDCRKKHFVVIHFRLQCRDSEGTVSTVLTDDDVRPIADREIKWTLPGQKGSVRTDGSGFGQIRGIFQRSPRTQRLKLATNGEFLYIRAGELNKIVTPKSWCPF